MKNAPQISIIIRTKNEERFIGETLAAVFEQDIDLPFEVIVIDSGSTDATCKIVRQFEVRLYEMDPRQFTYGRALNYGAGLAAGEYLINLSAHCIPMSFSWMNSLLDPLKVRPHVAATYGKQVPIKGLNPFEERLLTAAFTPNENGKIRPPFSNSNCAIRKATWDTYRFDEKASFAEDFIWSQTLPAEYQIEFVADAAVYHTHPLKFRYWARRCYENGILVKYLEHVYGLEYPWISRERHSGRVVWKRFLRIFKSYAAECSDLLEFLFLNRYFSFIPLLPIYVMLEHYFYYKGVAEGQRLYGSSKRQPR